MIRTRSARFTGILVLSLSMAGITPSTAQMYAAAEERDKGARKPLPADYQAPE